MRWVEVFHERASFSRPWNTTLDDVVFGLYYVDMFDSDTILIVESRRLSGTLAVYGRGVSIAEIRDRSFVVIP